MSASPPAPGTESRSGAAGPGEPEPGLGCVVIVSGTSGDTRRYRGEHKQEQLRHRAIDSLLAAEHEPELPEDLEAADALILHRVRYDDSVGSLIDRAHARGQPVLFDADDLIFDREAVPYIRSTTGLDRYELRAHHWTVDHLRQTLDRCDAVLASTDYLASYVRRLGKPAHVVRNVLGRDLLGFSAAAWQERRRPAEPVVLGYFSGTRTHDRDFHEATGALVRILDACPEVELLVVGYLTLDPELERLADRVRRLSFVPWQRLPALIASVDVNLAPLEPGNPFCEAKSELKYLEAAAVGVPTIASPTDAFAFAIRHGENGLLARDPDEWERSLRFLIDSPAARRRLGERARADVLGAYSPAARSGELVGALLAVRDALPAGAAPGRAPGSHPRRREDAGQPHGPDSLGEVQGERAVEQVFTAGADGLYRIDVRAGTRSGRARGRVVLRLAAAGPVGDPVAPVWLATAQAGAGEAADGDWLAFRFPAIADSQGKAYRFVVEMPEAAPGEGIELRGWRGGSPADSPAGELGGGTATDCLAFRSFTLPAGRSWPPAGDEPAAELPGEPAWAATPAGQRQWVRELRQALGWWQREAARWERTAAERQDWIGQLEKGKDWWEEQTANWQRFAHALEERIAQLEAELRRAGESQAEQAAGWQQEIAQAHARLSLLVEQAEAARRDADASRQEAHELRLARSRRLLGPAGPLRSIANRLRRLLTRLRGRPPSPGG